MAGNKKRIVTFESYMNINSWTVVEMKNNEWEFYLNPYLKSVPVSKKLILKQRGFDLARRTVAKYRQQLGIPVARMRREISPKGGN